MFRTVSVPVVAIYDIDILRDDTEFEATVKAIGYDPAMFKVWRNTIEDEVSGARAFLSRADLRRAIKDILANSEEKNVSQSDLKRIRSASTAGSGWSSLKKAGISMLSAGGIAAYKEIKERLEAKGVFILEQGELERLHPEVSGEDKARWLRTVIDEGLYKHSVAMPMLSRIEAYLSEAQKI
ncbi:MAG: hypothetical protein EOO20_16355 [Chryseobacterium sp.]|nr:MAG: hypothetical protein EOO20_16355 [Chryseobacterium sp.]